jgi:hypothetical protein
MHIEKIDNFIDKIINDYFENIFLSSNDFDKIYKEANFIKYQKEINEILKNYCDSINLDEIKELVKNNETISKIHETIKRYLGYYTFLSIGYNYKFDEKIYINNIVEFTKNQSEYKLKINNFFNAESNALIIKFNRVISNMITLFTADKSKIATLKTIPEYIETIKFLNTLDVDYITNNLVLKNIENEDKKIQCHNIIKTLIYIELYKNTEKNDLYKMLEMIDNIDGEYMYIDIVVGKKQTLDYDIFEKIVGPKNKYLAQEFWKMINEKQMIVELDNDEKINLLMQSKIVRPICDDFLLFSKNTERYDKIDEKGVNIKKKEDTKINYIVNKINLTRDYYSEQTKSDEKAKINIKKLFYQPLYNKKAILVNNNEDLQILHKFKNMSIISNENTEYLHELTQYMIYPYINFKDFDKYGFQLTLDNPIDIIRYVSINTSDDFKQNKNDALQLKVGNYNSTINIVGLLIPTNKKPLQCIKSKECVNIKDLTKKNKNGFDLFMKYLYESDIGLKKHNNSVYWIFDLDTDIVNVKTEKYDQTTKFTNYEQTKRLVGVLYDNIVNYVFNQIISELKKIKNLTFYKANKIIRYYETKLLEIKNEQMKNDLIKEISNMIIKIENPYDDEQDNQTDEKIEITLPVIFDKDKNIKEQLEIVTNKKIVQTIVINYQNDDINTLSETFINKMTCQHFIIWDKLISIKKSDPSLYTELIQNFIEQYIIENEDHEYVCKSCNNLVNIKTYVNDYSSEIQNIIVNTYLDISLDEISEYEHYKIAIRSLNKTIEKLSLLINLQYLLKISNETKMMKQTIIKNIIDVCTENLKYLTNIFKERNDKITDKYGIIKDLTDVFIFKFENGIFLYSVKETDEYKHIKQNNIIAYTIIMLLLEISDSHIYHIGTDKKELLAFNNIYESLFSGIKIISNDKGTTSNIIDYKILCYVLYIFAHVIAKYNMWSNSNEKITDKEKQKNIQFVQKKVIHTTIDLINSILEKFLLSKKNNKVFDNICNKLLIKINTLYKNNELYDSILSDNLSNKIIQTVGKNDNINYISLTGKFIPMPFEESLQTTKNPCRIPKLYMERIYKTENTIHHISHLSNCLDGKFHKWKISDKKYSCIICKITTDKIDEKNNNEIYNNYNYNILLSIAKIKCSNDGDVHIFSKTEKSKTCIKCGNSYDHKYSNDELSKLKDVIDKRYTTNIINKYEKYNMIDEESKKNIEYTKKVVEGVNKNFNNDIKFDFINTLINELQIIVGSETSDYNLNNNTYIIDHDHLGQHLAKHIILTGDTKIIYKKNHPFFNTNVLYYTNTKVGKIDVFYNANTKILLGYKEQNKQYVLSNINNRKNIIIKYSIFNKIKYLGYQSQYINIEYNFNKLMAEDNLLDKHKIFDILVYDIVKNRTHNLKNILSMLKITLQKILNNHNKQISIHDETQYFSNIHALFIEKYKNKFSDVKFNNDKHSVFKHWKGIMRGCNDYKENKITFDKIMIIDCNDLVEHDENGNIILFYIINELTQLLKINTNKSIKTILANFIIDFINFSFESYNEEHDNNNIDIKRFNYIVSSDGYLEMTEIPDEVTFNEIQMNDELNEEVEEKIDEIEEMNAIDMEENEDSDAMSDGGDY